MALVVYLVGKELVRLCTVQLPCYKLQRSCCILPLNMRAQRGTIQVHQEDSVE